MSRARAGEIPGLGGLWERGAVLVGRAAESAWLKRRVALARRGEGSAVLVAGEPGVGKTALIGRVCASARGAAIRRYRGMTADSPDRDPADPGPSSADRARTWQGATALFPPSALIPAASAVPATVSTTALNGVGEQNWTLAKPAGGLMTTQVAVSTFPWDVDARKTFALPMPTFSEECFVAYWASEPSGGLTLPSSVDGILDSNDAAYLLTTTASGDDGELDGLLVRAPACSLVRFERYWHLLAPSASTLTTSHPSSTGAIVLRTLPADTPAPNGASQTVGSDRLWGGLRCL